MTSITRATEHDVIVVGSRCAGAATARLLAQQGHDVLVLERATLPSDTVSTHAIARTGVVQLHRWGLLDAVLATGAPAIRQIVFHTSQEEIRRPLKARSGVDLLLAPRRHLLDAVLARAAGDAGAEVRTGVTVRDVLWDRTGRVNGVQGRDRDGRLVEARARFVVGADGLRSRVARCVGAPVQVAQPSSGATHYAYYRGDWPAMEYYLSDHSLAGIFPTNNGEACIWVCNPADAAEETRRRHATIGGAFEELVVETSPELAARVAAAAPASPVQGMLRLPNHVRQAQGPGWSLVGDAGYHRDAVTGHGISDAFRDAELLATALDEALAGCDEDRALARYQAERDRMLADIFSITVALANYPATGPFIELQKELAHAIDTQAAELAAWPLPPQFTLAA